MWEWQRLLSIKKFSDCAQSRYGNVAVMLSTIQINNYVMLVIMDINLYLKTVTHLFPIGQVEEIDEELLMQ